MYITMSQRRRRYARSTSLKLRKQREMEWKKSLIEAVFQRPDIWDREQQTHQKDKLLLNALWDEVSAVTGVESRMCRKTWKNLKDKYRSVYYEVITRMKNEGMSLKMSIKHVTWTYFHSMLFLKDKPVLQRHPPQSRSDQLQDGDEDDSDTETENDVLPCSLVSTIEYEKEDGVTGSTSSNGIEGGEEEEEEEEETRKVGFIKSLPSIVSIVSRNIKQEYTEPDPAQLVEVAFGQTEHLVKQEVVVEEEEQEQEQKEPEGGCDIEERFCQYLCCLLNEVPVHLQRDCRNMILKIANGFAAGNTPIVLPQNYV